MRGTERHNVFEFVERRCFEHFGVGSKSERCADWLPFRILKSCRPISHRRIIIDGCRNERGTLNEVNVLVLVTELLNRGALVLWDVVSYNNLICCPVSLNFERKLGVSNVTEITEMIKD